jgi:hypothetical protein
MIVGHARVSTDGQSLEAQHEPFGRPEQLACSAKSNRELRQTGLH